MAEPVRLFLDVDGVLNSYPVPEPRFSREKRRTVHAWNYELHFRPKIVALLEAFLRRRHAEMVWLSTWSHLCTAEIEPKLGFTGRYTVEPMPDASFNYYADDPHTWWKARTVETHLRENPEARAIWIDDDLVHPRTLEHFEQLFGDRLLTIAPDFSTGLREEHFRLMRRFTRRAPRGGHATTPPPKPAVVDVTVPQAQRMGPDPRAAANPYSLTPRAQRYRL